MIDPLLIPIVGMLIPIVLVPVILGVKYARRERELEHAERIKALELGRTLPRDESWWSLPRISVAIGAGVPAAVFFCAWQAQTHIDPAVAVIGRGGDSRLAWIAAGLVGLASVVCGSALAAWHFVLSRRDRPADHGDDFHAKAQFDADAFDVVSSRGRG